MAKHPIKDGIVIHKDPVAGFIYKRGSIGSGSNFCPAFDRETLREIERRNTGRCDIRTRACDRQHIARAILGAKHRRIARTPSDQDDRWDEMAISCFPKYHSYFTSFSIVARTVRESTRPSGIELSNKLSRDPRDSIASGGIFSPRRFNSASSIRAARVTRSRARRSLNTSSPVLSVCPVSVTCA